MTEHINIELNDYEALIIAVADIVNTTTTIQTDIGTLTSEIPNLSNKGYFSYYYGNGNNSGNAKHDSLGDFVRKAQQISTLAEILHQFVLDTYSKMVDADRILAIEVANLLLNSPETPAEAREALQNNPEEAVTQIQEQIAESQGEQK